MPALPIDDASEAAAARSSLSRPIAFSAGLAASLAALALCPLPPPLARWLALGALASTGAVFRRRGGRAAAALLGAALALARSGAPPAPGIGVPEGPGTLVAWLIEPPALQDGSGAAAAPGARADEAPSALARTRVRAREAAHGGMVSITIAGDARSLRAGHWVECRGRWLPPRGPRNPGERPRRDAVPLFWVPSIELARPIAFDPWGRGRRSIVEGVLAQARARAVELLVALFPPRHAGTLAALILGERRFLAPDLTAGFERTGTFHFLAISGQHVSILLVLLLRLPLPRRLGPWIRAALILGFGLLTGAAPPILRAVAMHLLGAAALACGRALPLLDNLAWTSAILLVLEPAWIVDLSFQLSTLAVFGIIVWGERWRCVLAPRAGRDSRLAARRRRRRRAPWLDLLAALSASSQRGLRSSLAVSIAASWMTAPLVLAEFQRVHLLLPLWNLVIIAPLTAAFAAGTLALALAAVHPVLGASAAWAASMLLDLIDAFLPVLAGLPGSAIYLPPPPTWAIAAAMAGLIFGPALAAVSPRWRRRLAALAFVFAAAAGALACSEIRGRRLGDGGPAIWCFDAGAGSAQLFLTPSGESMLVDAGSRDGGPRFPERLRRALLAAGVRRLDALVLTHKDADHVNAVDTLCRDLQVDRIVVSPLFERFPDGRARIERWRALGAGEVLVFDRGRRLEGGDAAGRGAWSLEVLHPAAGERLPLVERSNEGSMVLRFRFRPAGAGAATALLTGDIEERGVARLLSLETQLETGLLFYPHHGARNRLRETLLAATRPGQVIISAAAASGAIETAEALRQRGIAVHGTWMAGALRARLDAGGAWVVEAPLAARSAASAAGVGD